MKKMTLMAVAASAVMFVSCGSKMSTEAQKAWEDFKEKGALVETMEAADQFETYEEYAAACKEFEAATKAMEQYQTEYSDAIIDSMGVIAENFKKTAEQAAAMQQQYMQQLQEEGEEEGEEIVEEGEDIVEEGEEE